MAPRPSAELLPPAIEDEPHHGDDHQHNDDGDQPTVNDGLDPALGELLSSLGGGQEARVVGGFSI